MPHMLQYDEAFGQSASHPRSRALQQWPRRGRFVQAVRELSFGYLVPYLRKLIMERMIALAADGLAGLHPILENVPRVAPIRHNYR